jgi:putative transcriptional regulator
MTKKAFNKIAAGLEEAIAIARGEATPARLHAPAEIDVKAIRKKVGLPQESFAYAFGFTVEQIRAWEQGRNRPIGGVRAYLMLIDRDHEGVSRILGESRMSPLGAPKKVLRSSS